MRRHETSSGMNGQCALAAPRGAVEDTLFWLAGSPVAGPAAPRDDAAFQEARPADPIEAAQRRAAILAGLYLNRRNEARVAAVFEADPVVAEDPANGNLVTRRMVEARIGVFDAMLKVVGRPALHRAVNARMRLTLRYAFPFLTDDAQVEWALSEVRDEEIRAMLRETGEAELGDIAMHLASVIEDGGPWPAMQAFALIAHERTGEERGAAALANLLEPRTP